MSEVSIGNSAEDILNGFVSVRVDDGNSERIYKIPSKDMEAIFESIREQVRREMLLKIKEALDE